MVSKESSGAVLMKFTAMYARMVTEAVTKIALGMAMAQYLSITVSTQKYGWKFGRQTALLLYRWKFFVVAWPRSDTDTRY